jgi:hypothetical protein
MDNSLLIKKNPFYSSWIALAVFVFILIFQPAKATFYAIRPSDVWLLFCLFLQVQNGYYITIHFRNRFMIRNYGLFMGVLAIIATLIQASYSNISLNSAYIFNFYRFLRFLLIFKFVENILFYFSSNDAQKFWKVYTLIGIVVLILSFFEFNNIMSSRLILTDLYFEMPEEYLEVYLVNPERLHGVMGNCNATAILLVSTLTYPLLSIVNIEGRLINKILYIVYVFFVVYVLVVMTASRTSIFISLLIPVIILFAASRRLKEVFLVVSVMIILTISGILLYHRFESKIIVQDRITKAIQGDESLKFSSEGFGKWSGRNELWQERFKTFENEGNQLAILLGLGYTQAYKDYSDNGLISAFINTGLTGLILKLFLYYIFIKYGLLRAIRYFRWFEIDFPCLAFAISALALLLWEFTADLTEHYKLGQLFYVFLSIVMIINAKIFSINSQ